MQKLARYLGGLKATLVLLNHRLLQEEAVIKRTLDELEEDILFLVFPPDGSEEEALKARFLEAFYQEEYAMDTPPSMGTMQNRYLPKRGRIRSYVNKRASNADQGENAARSVYQGYSGYVHAASPHLMELVSFSDFKFDLDGVRDLDLFESHVADVANYFIRGAIILAAMAGSLDEPELFAKLKGLSDGLMARWS